jgi:hypothetical protein
MSRQTTPLLSPFDFTEAELLANRRGQLADSQMTRLASLVAQERRLLGPRALATGCYFGFGCSVPLMLIAALGPASLTLVVVVAVSMAIGVTALALLKGRVYLQQAANSLTTGALQTAEGRVELTRSVAVPKLRRCYQLRLESEHSGHSPVWFITTEQGAALAQGQEYRVYHTGGTIQSLEPSSTTQADQPASLQDRPPVPWGS